MPGRFWNVSRWGGGVGGGGVGESPSPGRVQGEAVWLFPSGMLWRTFLHWVGRLDQRPQSFLQHVLGNSAEWKDQGL